MLEKIKVYLDSLDFQMLSMEELEHYTNIYIALENKYLDDIQRQEIIKKLDKRVE